jgi:hypothetical protein
VPKSSKFTGEEYGGKPQFASVQRCFRKGNGGVRKRDVLLENLFIFRIGSRDPGPHYPCHSLIVSIAVGI